jgi:hypothetical protein
MKLMAISLIDDPAFSGTASVDRPAAPVLRPPLGLAWKAWEKLGAGLFARFR